MEKILYDRLVDLDGSDNVEEFVSCVMMFQDFFSQANEFISKVNLPNEEEMKVQANSILQTSNFGTF